MELLSNVTMNKGAGLIGTSQLFFLDASDGGADEVAGDCIGEVLDIL